MSGGRVRPLYGELLVPVDNSPLSSVAVDRAIEISRATSARVTATHVYAARLHDIRFRQLEIGLPARFQAPEEIKRQRKIHDKLIRSEEHTSELQSRLHLVCRLLLEKKKKTKT